MAIDYIRNIISSGYNLSKINDNFAKIQAALQDGLSRSGTGPNQMLTDIDLNDNDLLNVKTLDVQNITYQGATLVPSETVVVPNAMLKVQYDPTNVGSDAFDLTNHRGQVSSTQIADEAVNTSTKVKFDSMMDAPKLIQAKLMEVNLGGASAPINADATNALQGVTVIEFEGRTLLFATQRSGGANWASTERQRIYMMPLATNGSSVVPEVITSTVLNIGHGYDLSAVVEAGVIYLYTSRTISTGQTGTAAGKGFSRIRWRGADTSQADVETFTLWGQEGSGHPYEKYNRAGVAVSPDGKRIWMISAAIEQSVGRRVAGYDLEVVRTAPDPLLVSPTYQFDLALVTGQSANAVQGITDDGEHLCFAIGGTDPLGQNRITMTDFNGYNLRDVFVDLASAQYGLRGILDHPTQGHPWRFEPEGITPYMKGFLVTVDEGWYTGLKIVTWQGYNWACISKDDTTGIPPSNGGTWLRTTKAATDGAWSSSVNYGHSNSLSVSKKTVYYVGPSLGLAQEESTQNGISDTSDPSALRGGQGSGQTVLGFQWRAVLGIRAWAERLGKYFNALEYDGAGRWKVFDQRFDSDNTQFVSMQAQFTTAMKALILRAKGTTDSDGAVIRLYANDDPTYPSEAHIKARSTNTFVPILPLIGSVTWDPPSLAAGGRQTLPGNINVPGARLGDAVIISFSSSLVNTVMSGYINANDTVVVNHFNPDSVARDLPSGTVSAFVFKQ